MLGSYDDLSWTIDGEHDYCIRELLLAIVSWCNIS